MIYSVVGVEFGVSSNRGIEVYRSKDKNLANEVHDCLLNLIFIEDLSAHMPPIDGWFMVREYLISLYTDYGLTNTSGFDDFYVERIDE